MMLRPAWVGTGEPSVNDHLREEYAERGISSETLRLDSVATRSVAQYLEYLRVVGNADGGVLLTGEHASARVCSRPLPGTSPSCPRRR
jgi:hypothetical protein